ncbi:MAG: hypothetical protein JRJ03_04180 [Deltaproteobacteria bacterium]|nr:hypothetical protein [Deltaproteobacteria bacterium]
MSKRQMILRSEGFELELGVAGIDSLFLHERVVDEFMEGLICELRSCGTLEDPVVIERNNIVLDGNHRTFAFRKLGLRFMAVCKVDYFHEDIKLRYWFRLLRKVESLAMVTNMVEETGGAVRRVADLKSLEKRMEENPYSCGIKQGDFFASVVFDRDRVSDAVSAYDQVEDIQRKLIKTGVELEYIPCRQVYEEDFPACLGDNAIVILTPRITKEMVVEAVMAGKIFAPKSTRHLIPVRPVNLNVPIGWFKEEIALEEISARVRELLDSKEVMRLEPGRDFKGRIYDEPLLVFQDKR